MARQLKRDLLGLGLCAVVFTGGQVVMSDRPGYRPNTEYLSRAYEITSELEDINVADIIENPKLVEHYKGLVAEKESIKSSPGYAREVDERQEKRFKGTVIGGGISLLGILGAALYARKWGRRVIYLYRKEVQ